MVERAGKINQRKTKEPIFVRTLKGTSLIGSFFYAAMQNQDIYSTTTFLYVFLPFLISKAPSLRSFSETT